MAFLCYDEVIHMQRSVPMTTENYILLKNKNKIYIRESKHELYEPLLATALMNIEQLGFTFSTKMIERLRTMDDEQFKAFIQQLEEQLITLVGADVEYEPFYPNFPKQVVDLDLASLYFNAILHYSTNARIDFQKKARRKLIERHKLTIIDLAEEDEFEQLITQLLSSKSSISQSNFEILDEAIQQLPNPMTLIPEEMPNKEIMAFAVASLLKTGKVEPSQLLHFFKTPTDVLRFAVARSEGDVSLKEAPHFISFKRSERRLILTILESIKGQEEDFLRYKEYWVRLAERLHPGEHKEKYPHTYEVITKLRNHIKIETFNGRIEKAIASGDLTKVLEILSTRPGEFARRLNHILRSFNEHPQIAYAFSKVANEVSTPVLLQLRQFFINSKNQKDVRSFLPKGNAAKMYVMEQNQASLKGSEAKTICAICELNLKVRFSQLEPLGKVYLSKSLKNMTVPLTMRSSSQSLHTLARGSRMKLDDQHILRMFIHWKNLDMSPEFEDEEDCRVDIDLSASFYDEDFKVKGNISYYDLKNMFGIHSGDIVDAPNGAAEFIDLNLKKLKKRGIRYVVAQVYSYNRAPFYEIPQLYMGWMAREKANRGELFEPATVRQKFSLTHDETKAMPFVIDVKEDELIWLDTVMTDAQNSISNNYYDDCDIVDRHLQAVVSEVRPNLYDLLKMHVDARGERVKTKDEAEILFVSEKEDTIKQQVTPQDVSTILADYL